MLFRTFDPYYNDEVTIYKNEDCFICYENERDKKFKIIKLKLQNDYEKLCNCDGWVHIECLNKWYDRSNKCPICRIKINKKITYYVYILDELSYYYFMFCYNTLNYPYRVLQFFATVMLIYYAYEYYKIIFHKFEQYRNNNMNNMNNINTNNYSKNYVEYEYY